MKLREYSDTIKHTAIYPKDVGKIYTILGMIDEMGEVSEKLDFEDPIAEIEDEIGDTFWYITATIREFGFDDLFDYFEENRDQQANRNKYPKYLGKLGMQVGCQLAGRIKKVIRDENRKFTKEKTREIKEYVRSYLNTIMIIVNKTGMRYEVIFEKNINKLLDRKERGVLKGDGDKR